jgi:hypothetical protein
VHLSSDYHCSIVTITIAAEQMLDVQAEDEEHKFERHMGSLQRGAAKGMAHAAEAMNPLDSMN